MLYPDVFFFKNEPMALLQQYTIGQIIQLLTDRAEGEPLFHLATMTGNERLITQPYRPYFYSLVALSAGALDMTVNLRSYTIQAGQVAFIKPAIIHTFSRASSDLAVTVVFFTDSFLDEVVGDTTRPGRLPFFQFESLPTLTLTGQEQQRLNELFRLFYNYPGTGLPTKYLLQTLLFDLKTIYTRETDTKVVGASRPLDLVNRFSQLVAEQYMTKRRVADYAGQLGVSAKHLSETIKQSTGQPASFWIDYILLQEAQVLLRQTTHTVSEIASYLQFSDQSAFGKFFRTHTSLSPSLYRKNP